MRLTPTPPIPPATDVGTERRDVEQRDGVFRVIRPANGAAAPLACSGARLPGVFIPRTSPPPVAVPRPHPLRPRVFAVHGARELDETAVAVHDGLDALARTIERVSADLARAGRRAAGRGRTKTTDRGR